MTETTLRQLKQDAREELESEIVAGTVDRSNIDRCISEEADSQTPVMNAELLEIAAQDSDVALRIPECGPAFDGTATPVNTIAANIYELIAEDLWSYWNELVDSWICGNCKKILDESDLDFESEDDDAEQNTCPDCGKLCTELER